MEFLLSLTLVLIIAGAVLFLIVEIFAVFVGEWYGAPYVKSKKEKIAVMLELAQIKPAEGVIDLGSGDGTLVIEAARLGARATGIEINPFLVWCARRRAKKLGLQDRAHFVRCDFRRYPLNKADVVLFYLWPSTIEKLKEKLSRELKPGSRIISNGFPIKGWAHIMEKDKVYLYDGRRYSST